MLGISTRAPLPTAIQSVRAGAHAPADNIRTDRRVSASRVSSVKQFETQALLSSLRDTRDRDLERRGDVINRYADEAKLNSLRRAAELTVDGDHVGAAIWRRITTAIERLTDDGTTELIMW